MADSPAASPLSRRGAIALAAIAVLLGLGIYFGVMLVACLTPYGLLAPVMLVFLLRRHGVAPRLSLATLLVTTLLDAFAMAFWMLAAIAVEAVVSFRLMVPWMAVMSCMALMLGVMIGATFFVKYPRRWLQLASGVATMFQLRAQTRRGVIRLLLRLRRAALALFDLPVTERITLFAVSLSYWGIFLSVMHVAARVAGVHIPWSQALLVQLVAMSAGHVAGLPGGMVSSEAAGIFLLSSLLGASSAVTVVLLWRFLTFHFYVLAGVATMPLLSRYFGKGFALPAGGRGLQGRE